MSLMVSDFYVGSRKVVLIKEKQKPLTRKEPTKSCTYCHLKYTYCVFSLITSHSSVLLFKDGLLLKLCDFGTAKKLEHTLTNAVGTIRYMAPEVIRGEWMRELVVVRRNVCALSLVCIVVVCVHCLLCVLVTCLCPPLTPLTHTLTRLNDGYPRRS